MTTKLNKAQLEFVEKITKSLDEGIVPWRATWGDTNRNAL